MKRSYPSGWEKKKKQKAKDQEIQRLSGSLLKFTQKVSSHVINQAEPLTDPDPTHTGSNSESYSQVEDCQTRNEKEVEKNEIEIHNERDEGKSNKEKEGIGGEDINEDCTLFERPTEESENTIMNFDVGNWPIPVPDSLRTDIIRQGSAIYQNLDGPFESVQKPGESSKGQTRQLNNSWFYKQLPSGEKILRKWMVYSHVKKSLFCFCCKLFDVNDKRTTSFITGFNVWWKFNPKVSDHERSDLHISSLEKWKTLEANLLKNKTIDAAHQGIMENERKKWRDILYRLLDVTLFLAKQNLPFRGHREDIDSGNRGNFLELVSLLSQYDPVLKEHSIRLQQSLQAGMVPVTYLSPAVQNEFISILGNAVKTNIISAIKEAKYYGIMFDSTPDISHTEQMSQVVRYVEIKNRKVEVRESFLGFIQLSGKKASNITEEILHTLQKDGLDLSLCRSQGYDNAATMAGIHTGVQTRIKELNPKAVFIPCANHSLNLCGVHAFGCVTVSVTFIGTLESVFKFFSCSTHRWDVLKEIVGVTVKRLVDTRWSAHHDAIKPILNNFERLVDAVDKLCDSSENLDTRAAAEVLMTNISNFNFLSFLHLWYSILSEVNQTQKYLQIEGLSLDKCILKLRSLNIFLEQGREELIQKAFDYATTICAKLDIDVEIRTRRRVKKMMAGEKAKDASLTPQQELKRSMLECIDNFHVEINKRLTSMNNVFNQFAAFQSENLVKASEENIQTYIHQFTTKFDDLEEEEMLPEVKRLRKHLEASGIKTDDAASWTSLQMLTFIIDMDFRESLPNLTEGLKLFLTICVSVASCEKSFSKLKLIKNYLRSTMSQSRLTSLAILSIEHELAKDVDFDNLITQFSEVKARKKKF